MNFVEIERAVIKWAEDRNLYQESSFQDQIDKLEEEFFELATAETKDEVIDSIGDMLVVMTNLAKFADVTLTQCYEYAYNEIKDRKGKMVNGKFVKESDLK